MKPIEVLKLLRREAALDPAVLERGRARLMAQIHGAGKLGDQIIVPQLPYADPRAAVEFLERAFGFTERLDARVVDKRTGAVGHTMVEFRGALVGIGGQGGHGAVSPKEAGTPTLYLSVYVPDVDAHHERARAAGARIVQGLRDQFWGDRTYECLDLENHRWRFHQRVRAVPQAEWSWSDSEPDQGG